MAISLEDRFKGAMIAHCLGDSLGAIWEGVPPFTGSIKTDLVLRYTDDTEMMMNLARAIIRDGTVNPDTVAEEFVKGFTPTRGYGPGTIRVIELIKKGVPYYEATRAYFPEGSMGNGAAMRVTPVGLFFHRNLEKLKEAVKIQAEITHAHPVAIEGATVVALSVAMALRGVGLEVIPDEILPHLREPVLKEKILALKEMLQKGEGLKEAINTLGNGVLAHESTVMALYLAIVSEGDPLKAIEMAIQAGGDTDTIGAMAGAIAGAYSGTEHLSEDTIEALECYERICSLSKELYKVFLSNY